VSLAPSRQICFANRLPANGICPIPHDHGLGLAGPADGRLATKA
jgi:hypothetical protein